ncbi:MAG: hypothetical protein R3A10_03360 [Caldilineaceae bacterium]
MMAGPAGRSGYGQQPPVVVIAPGAYGQGHQPALTARQYGMPSSTRRASCRFVVVGPREKRGD